MAGRDRRTLILPRHAKSAWPDVPDPERPLARRGQRGAPRMGRWLRASGYLPDQVLCSPARRARETWQLAAPAPPVSFDGDLYEGSAAQILDLLRRVRPTARTLLVIGHDPAIQDLALTLSAGHPPARAESESDAAAGAALDRLRVKFPTAAVAVLEFTGGWERLGPGGARLTCFVTPREVRATTSPDSDAL